ncbi:protein unc-93 homolog A isoform X1 [Brienomyrus brachyistius]|uniref:protein unc-93 homolog A isoform X1 n=1 Tax=Brienomyrus brachyistius TaxID=42636 RepID=UPI0020B42ED9|nr:protein unc-93 homolog A isoform X1 [Brienomyrus brachyistius]
MNIDRNLKNVLVVSFGFLFLFTAYGGLQSLQSSLNAQDGMGVASLSVIYASIILSSMFLPPILIKNLGCKWTIVGSMGCYVAYSLGNFFPGWPALMATSVILGLGGSPLWSAKCTYLTLSGNQQAAKDGKKGPDVINHYFGIFFLIFQSSGVWGNLMSSLIFGQDASIADIPDDRLQSCGTGACLDNSTTSGNVTTPEKSLVNILLGCYIGVGIFAIILVAVFLDNIDRAKAQAFRDKREPFCSTFFATFKHLRDRRQLLLIPLTMYSGFEQSFLAGEYTRYYVTCALGIHFVGYVMICFAATNSVSSFTVGKLSQYTGRFALFTFAAVINLAGALTFLLWKPHPNELPVFFVLPALWGLADAIWQTQTNALYGVLFPDHKEAAFANYRMWESVGFVIAFAYSNFICLDIKLYILIAVLILSMLLYGWVEYMEHRNPTLSVEYSGDAVKLTEKGPHSDVPQTAILAQTPL